MRSEQTFGFWLGLGVCAACVPLCLSARPYWLNPRIHNFGNLNALHAMTARRATRFIDIKAYNDENTRETLMQDMPADYSIVSLGCGVGACTFPLLEDMPPSQQRPNRTLHRRLHGVDTSPQMLRHTDRCVKEHTEATAKASDVGKFSSLSFARGNAEDYGPTNGFDAAIVSFVCHEAPAMGRVRILENACRIARHRVVVSDISEKYDPSWAMLTGEPYLLDYQRHFNDEVVAVADALGWTLDKVEHVPGHQNWWILTKDI